MTKERCLRPDEMEAVESLAPESWERRHIDNCPRCSALLSTYTEFLRDRSIPEGSDLEDAGARLRPAFRGATLQGTDPEKTARKSMGRSAGGRRLRVGWVWVLGPAAAAALLVLGLRTGTGFLRGGPGPDPLRGPKASEEEALPGRLVVFEPRPRGTDGLELRWRSTPEVSSYEVILFRGDLEEFIRFGPLADTVCVIRRKDLPSGISPGAVVGFQVVGYRDGDPVAVSPASTARLP